MIKHRIHYLIGLLNARCGIVRPINWTMAPDRVTCKSCKRLMAGEMK